MRNKYYPPTNEDIENHQLENYRDQIKQLEVEYELAVKNEEMFDRLSNKWRKERSIINNAISRLLDKIIEQKKKRRNHPINGVVFFRPFYISKERVNLL